MAIIRSDLCPACETSRLGLRYDAPCAHCGCPPGAELRTIRQSRRGVDLLLLVGLVLVLIAIAGKPFGRWTPEALLALGACVLVTRLVIVRRQPRAVLWAEGCVLLDWGDAPLRFAWREVDDVRYDADRRAVRIALHNGGIDSVPVEFFGSAQRASTFASAAARAVGRA